MPIDELKVRITQMGNKKNLNEIVKADLVTIYLEMITNVSLVFLLLFPITYLI
jgi:hypothetical protein